jgi:hypothetical protein
MPRSTYISKNEYSANALRFERLNCKLFALLFGGCNGQVTLEVASSARSRVRRPRRCGGQALAPTGARSPGLALSGPGRPRSTSTDRPRAARRSRKVDNQRGSRLATRPMAASRCQVGVAVVGQAATALVATQEFTASTTADQAGLCSALRRMTQPTAHCQSQPIRSQSHLFRSSTAANHPLTGAAFSFFDIWQKPKSNQALVRHRSGKSRFTPCL